MSDVCESSSVCTGDASSAAAKSMSSRLMKSWSVLGAERDGDVRMRMECSLTWAVNLLKAS